jgi:hypothetical protein
MVINRDIKAVLALKKCRIDALTKNDSVSGLSGVPVHTGRERTITDKNDDAPLDTNLLRF